MRYWVDDRLLESADARVSVTDHGFVAADGVYETLRTVRTESSEIVPFAADRHCDRLERGALALGLPRPDTEIVRMAMLAVCAANADTIGRGGRIRVTYTAGPGALGAARPDRPRPTLVVTAEAMKPRTGAETLAISPWPRNERSAVVGVKSLAGVENIMMAERARALGAGDALLFNLAGEICETTGANIFLVRGGEIVTPELECGPVAGITRELVLEWARAEGLAIRQTRVRRSDLMSATACFLTSATRDVQRVSGILDTVGRPLKPFPADPGVDLVRTVADLFARNAAADPNP
jgi:branched-chain amino acid aminotransferase